MRTLLGCVTALTIVVLCIPSGAAAQRRARIGPTASTISIQDASGQSHDYTAFGGSAALISSDDGEMGATVLRYNDLSSDACTRALTFYGLDSYYYPIGPKGIAPFASTEIGLARVTESSPRFGCGLLATTATSSEIGFAYGLGLRVTVGSILVGLVEGRFFQVPNSAIQSLEGRANVSLAFGQPRESQLLNGTVGPAVSYLIHLSGPLEARAPFPGVRFRRDTKTAGSVGLQIDYAPLEITTSCTACRPTAILFAPAYEASARPAWGRVYGALGVLIAGFYTEGPDRGVAQGAHAGIGVDVHSGKSLMWNVNSRVLWLRRNNGDNVFGVQVGASLAPRLGTR